MGPKSQVDARGRTVSSELKWEITPPARWSEKEGGSSLAFFCGDVMPRDLWVTTWPAVLVPTRPSSDTDHPNGTLSIVHVRILAPPNVFGGVATELTAIVGEPPIEVSAGEFMWLLDLPGTVAPKVHPQLLVREPDVEDEDELRFVQTHGAGLFEIGVLVDGSRGKRGWSDTPFGRVAWIPV